MYQRPARIGQNFRVFSIRCRTVRATRPAAASKWARPHPRLGQRIRL